MSWARKPIVSTRNPGATHFMTKLITFTQSDSRGFFTPKERSHGLLD
jgi:hypothetical protein